ncbi:MAG: response regulator transcription factor [Verrucomicrobiota bacterium]
MIQPPTLLLVEDDPIFLDRLGRALASRDWEIHKARSASTALAMARKQKPAEAVVDLRLPDSDGLDLVRDLLRLCPGLPLVVLTGFGSIATAMDAVRLGARDYLTKPADPEQILAALRGDRILMGNPKEVPTAVPSLDRVEWEHIQRTLADTGGNISQAARLLRIDRRTLQRKLGKHPPRC